MKRQRESSTLPWARPRFELALLALIAVAALSPLPGSNPQDSSRMCLAQALLHGHLSNTSCLTGRSDFATYHDHLYTDKAPGLSLIELPSVALLNPLPPHGGIDLRLWGVRVLSVGIALLLCAFLVGRVSEGIAPGFGSITLATFSLGTLAGSLAQISFDHVPAALAVFGAFLLAWKHRPFLAGLVAGAAILIEYESGLIVAVIALYIAATGGRALLRYLAGAVPGVAILAAYNWAAFGAPWHLSYRYVSTQFAAEQSAGLFGIGLPTRAGTFAVFSGNGGLLVVSPVLVLAVYGLVRLRSRFPLEALVAAVVTFVMLFMNSGYYLPYGGTSPGPRFLTTALPFLALGLGPAFRWRPRLTTALAVISVTTSTAINLVWADGIVIMRQTVWGELLRIPADLGAANYVKALSPNVVNEVVSGSYAGVLLVVAATASAMVLAIRAMPWSAIRSAREGRPIRSATPKRGLVLAGVVVLAVLAADVLAGFGFPYGNGFQPRRSPVTVSISGTPKTSYRGGDVNYELTVQSLSQYLLLPDVVLTIRLDPAMLLVGPPKVTIGDGCTGTETIVCRLNYLPAGESGTIWFGVQFADAGTHSLSAHVTSDGFGGPAPTIYSVEVGD